MTSGPSEQTYGIQNIRYLVEWEPEEEPTPEPHLDAVSATIVEPL